MNRIINSTEVRKNWSEIIDTVVRKSPVFIKRNRDILTFLSIEQLDLLLDSFRLTLSILPEEDGSFTGVIEELDLLGSGVSIDKLVMNMIKELIEYSEEYMINFDMYYRSANRRVHFPYVYKVVAHEREIDKLKGMFDIKIMENQYA